MGIDESEAYRRGYDCGVNGANMENCHFAIFSTHKKMKEWERGKADADKHGSNQHCPINPKRRTRCCP